MEWRASTKNAGTDQTAACQKFVINQDTQEDYGNLKNIFKRTNKTVWATYFTLQSLTLALRCVWVCVISNNPNMFKQHTVIFSPAPLKNANYGN